jgi:hypothetical protein
VHGWSCIWRDNGLGRACIDWVVAGGESGPNARPIYPAWARSLRDQCVAADVPFLFKQWGAWAPVPGDDEIRPGDMLMTSGGFVGTGSMMRRIGKKRAGRLLDGVLHDGYPA